MSIGANEKAMNVEHVGIRCSLVWISHIIQGASRTYTLEKPGGRKQLQKPKRKNCDPA